MFVLIYFNRKQLCEAKHTKQGEEESKGEYKDSKGRVVGGKGRERGMSDRKVWKQHGESVKWINEMS